MKNYYFHIEQGGSRFKRIYLLRENSRHEAVESLIRYIGGHDYATGLVRSWEEEKYRPDPGVIYLG